MGHSTGDSDALAHGLRVSVLADDAFDWADYSCVTAGARFDATTLANMLARAAQTFDGSTGYVDSSSAFVDATECSMCCWFKTSTNAVQILMWVGDDNNNVHFQRLNVSGASVTARHRADATNEAASDSTIDPDDGSWHFAGATFTATERIAYGDNNVSTPDTNTVTKTNTYANTSIGASGGLTPDDFFNGQICRAMWFNAKLSEDQMLWIQANEPTLNDLITSTHANNPGVTNLVAYNPLTEKSGVCKDTHGTLHMSRTGTVTRADGYITETVAVEEKATTFVSASSQKMTAESDPGGTYPFTVALWVNPTDVTGSERLFSIGSSSSNSHYFAITKSLDDIVIQTGSAGGSGTNNNGVAVLSNGVWCLVLARWDSTSSVWVSIDGGNFLEDTDNIISDPVVDRMGIGVFARTTDSDHADATIGQVMLFSSALNNTDASELWNGSAGVTGRQLLDGDVALTSAKTPVHVWPCSSTEAAGRVADIVASGGITLTEAASPTDSDGIPAGQVDGDVYQLTDLTGNDRHLQQTGTDTRPHVVRVTDGNGYAMRFDGSDDTMKTASFTETAQPNTLLMLTDITDNSADQGLVDGIAAANEQSLQVNSTGDFLRLDGGTAVTSNLDADYGNLHAVIGVFDGADSIIYQDGGSGYAGNAGAESITGITLGSEQAGGNPSKQDFRQLAFCNESMSKAAMNEILTEWQKKHGITPTTIPDVTRGRARSFASLSTERLYTEGSYDPSTATSFSISAWVKVPTSESGIKEIAGFYRSSSTDGGIHIFFDASDELRLRIEQDDSLATENDFNGFALNTGEWRLVMASVNATSLDVWLDGSADAKETHSRSFPSIDSMAIGARNFSTPEYYFDGNIDNVSFYEDVYFTDAQAADLYALGINPNNEYLSAIQADASLPDPTHHYHLSSTAAIVSFAEDEVGELDMTASGTDDVQGIPAGD